MTLQIKERLLRKAIETLSNCLSEAMWRYEKVKKVFDQLTKYGSKKDFTLPYAAKMVWVCFSGTNLDDSSTLRPITANQMALQAPPIQCRAAAKAMSGAEDLHVAECVQLTYEGSGARTDKQGLTTCCAM